MRTSCDFWSLWTSSAILSSVLWNFLKGRFDQLLLTALSLFFFLEAKQIQFKASRRWQRWERQRWPCRSLSQRRPEETWADPWTPFLLFDCCDNVFTRAEHLAVWHYHCTSTFAKSETCWKIWCNTLKHKPLRATLWRIRPFWTKVAHISQLKYFKQNIRVCLLESFRLEYWYFWISFRTLSIPSLNNIPNSTCFSHCGNDGHYPKQLKFKSLSVKMAGMVRVWSDPANASLPAPYSHNLLQCRRFELNPFWGQWVWWEEPVTSRQCVNPDLAEAQKAYVCFFLSRLT